jgi:prophage maintenance system killer protein
LQEKSVVSSRLKKLIYGTIEIRESSNKKYIYVHYREDGVLMTKYIGEYTNELYSVILENNNIAKELKKKLREVNKELKKLNYVENELSSEVELNVDVARRNLVDSIYKQAMLEGGATTYSYTETIINGGKVNNITTSDIIKVVNLKHAWDFILSRGVITYASNYNLLCQINSIVEEGFSYNAGKIRQVPFRIGGSSYISPIPFEAQVKEEIDNILNSTLDELDKATNLLLCVMKKQIFLGGNKRSAVIFANHFLISKGKGLIVIPAEFVNDYKKLLIEYYETDNRESIVKFIKEKCTTII